MAKKLTAFRASLETLKQLKELAEYLGESKSAVIVRAIERLWCDMQSELD